MDRRNNAQDKRNQKLNAVLTEQAAAIAAIPAVAEAVTEFQTRLELVRPAITQKQQSRQAKGAVTTKNVLEAPLIKQLVKYSNALHLLHKKEGDLETALSLYLRPSEFTNLPQPELLAEAKDVADLAQKRQAALGTYGIQPASVVALRQQVTAYGQSLPAYKQAVERGKVGGKTVRTVLRELNAYVTKDLRAAVELLVDDAPEAYALIREAMRIDDAGGPPKPRGKGKGKGKGKKTKGGDTPPAPEGPAA